MVLAAAAGMPEIELLDTQHPVTEPPTEPVQSAAADCAQPHHDAIEGRPASLARAES
jgi:hypothetical protein